MLSRTVARASIATTTIFIACLAAGPAVTAQSATAGVVTGEYIVAHPDQTAVSAVTVVDGWRSEPQGPQEVRIMNRIIRTALDDVESPELPEALKPEGSGEEDTGTYPSYAYAFGEYNRVAVDVGIGGSIVHIGEKGVTGFYMKGYGYLFNIRWHVGGSAWSVLNYSDRGDLIVALEEQNTAVQRILAERVARRARTEQEQETEESRLKQAQEAAQEALEQEQEKGAVRAEAQKAWRLEYSEKLVDALTNVIATYGSTLHQVQPDEAITFIAEFGSDEQDSVTLTILGRELRGPDAQGADRVRAAIKVSRGGTETSDALKSQINIMSEIIDAAFEADEEVVGEVSAGRGFNLARTYNTWNIRGSADAQYIPGYGVIFRKSARQSLSRLAISEVKADAPESAAEQVFLGLQARLEESVEEYAKHLEDLKRKTAEIFATYGASMSELSADEWLSIHYDVGSATQLLQGGPDYFLVQARMGDVRSASENPEGADWLFSRLITNERQE
jgi:hypothetical protein